MGEPSFEQHERRLRYRQGAPQSGVYLRATLIAPTSRCGEPSAGARSSGVLCAGQRALAYACELESDLDSSMGWHATVARDHPHLSSRIDALALRVEGLHIQIGALRRHVQRRAPEPLLHALVTRLADAARLLANAEMALLQDALLIDLGQSG